MRTLGTIAGVVNMICMGLAAHANDTQVFLIGFVGAGFSGYAILHTLEERQAMGETPVGFRSLAVRIRWDLKQKGLAPGQRLAGVRELAQHYGTTRTTVARALKILADDKIIEIVHGRGTYVAGGVREDRPKDRIAWELVDHMKDKPTGWRLPTGSELMRQHGVSHPTVVRAFKDLIQEGYVRRTPTGRYEKA